MNKKDFVINYPENQRIIDRMKEEIDRALGSGTWDKITYNNCPNGNMDNLQLSAATYSLLEQFDRLADNLTANHVFSNVKHALKHSDFEWARNKFLNTTILINLLRQFGKNPWLNFSAVRNTMNYFMISR